jgi:hypothetical protein
MKAINLLVVAGAGFGLYWLLTRPVRATPLTYTSAQQFPGFATGGAPVGATSCPPGYYLTNTGMQNICVPIPQPVPGTAVPTIVRAGEEMVYVDGKLTPISEVFG